METKNLFEKVLKDNEIIKGQLNNLQTSLQMLKNNMIESQNNKNNINFSSLLDDLNISSTNDEINQESNKNIKDKTDYNQNRIIVQDRIENKYSSNINNNANNKYTIYKGPENINEKQNIKCDCDDNIHKRNIKKLLKEKEVINQIYLLKENYNNYNNYNIYNRSCIETSSKKNKDNKFNGNNINRKNIFYNEENRTKNQTKNKKINIKNNYILNSDKKCKRTNSMININTKSNRKNINSKNVNKLNNKKNINKLRNSYDDYYQKNNKYIKSNKNKDNSNTNKRIEILNYLKEINNLQNIISQLKKENSILKSSLEKEKQKNNKFRKLTEEIINHFEKANNK